MTERAIPVGVQGPVALSLTMNTGRIRIIVDPGLKQAQVVLRTTDTSGPSADAVLDATSGLTGQNLQVRVPHKPVVSGGIFIQASIGTLTIGGTQVTADGQEIKPASVPDVAPVEADIRLPQGSTVKLGTQTAVTGITGTLDRLDYAAASGRLTAEHVGVLDASITSGEVMVGEVTGELDATLTSGTLGVGAYSGRDARLHLTHGNARVHATPKSSGRLRVTVISGYVNVTGAAHLDTQRRVTSGSVRIS